MTQEFKYPGVRKLKTTYYLGAICNICHRNHKEFYKFDYDVELKIDTIICWSCYQKLGRDVVELLAQV